MPRKSKAGNKVLKKLESLFDLDIEVMMIIILIVFAILLICFLNKTKKRESFYQGVETTPASTPETCPALIEATDLSKPHVRIFYAEWCGHSQTFLNEQKKILEEVTNEKCSFKNRIILYDIDAESGKTLGGDVYSNTKTNVTNSGVTKLPSFYQYYPNNDDGKKYVEFKNGGQTSIKDIITFLEKTK